MAVESQNESIIQKKKTIVFCKFKRNFITILILLQTKAYVLTSKCNELSLFGWSFFLLWFNEVLLTASIKMERTSLYFSHLVFIFGWITFTLGWIAYFINSNFFRLIY